MIETGKTSILVLATCGLLGWACNPAAAAVHIEGQVQAGGGPLANSTVTLWEANAGDPKQLAQTQTGSDGRFELGTNETPSADVSLYLVAKGGVATVNKGSSDNPAIALLTVLGNTLPDKVVINEMTTVASVWTNKQFLDGTAIKGHALGLRIAAGNVPNFVDLATGGWGVAIKTRSTAARRRQWPILRRSLTCSRVAPRELMPTLATISLRRPRLRTAKWPPTRWRRLNPSPAILGTSQKSFSLFWTNSIRSRMARTCDLFRTCRT